MSEIPIPELSPTDQLIEDIAGFTFDPLGFVKYIFPWGTGDLERQQGPRVWQKEILTTIGNHMRNPETRNIALRIAVASGKGIGKSALIAMIVNWGLSTCEDCRIVIMANTGTQLATKTAPEVQKWFRLAINRFFWEITSTAIYSRIPERVKTWRADFLTWSEENPEASAGLHNRGKRIIVVVDEASVIPKPIWDVIEGYLTDEETQLLVIAFGNPTENTGEFREFFGSKKHRWVTRQIDARKVEGTNKEQIAKWIEDEGEDSDFVRIWVKGEFPRFGTFQFISSEAVEKCRKYKASGFESLPKVMTVDVARFGDDETVIACRQGRKFRILEKQRGWDTFQTTAKVIEWIGMEVPDAVIVDADGIGAGVFDNLNHRGFGKNLYEFHGGETPIETNKYFNKRAECWGLMKAAITAGMEIPDTAEIADQLTGIRYSYSNDQKIQLEKKDSMKLRGLMSPDVGDACAMSYSVVLQAQSQEEKEYQERVIGPMGLRRFGSETGWMR
jgi:hypothetical protein